MNYTLHQLQVFLKVAELKSITKAADALHLTQPAVSIQLKNLQEQFDIPLTEVVGRQLFVTEFGVEVAKAAENILNEVYAINYKTLAYKGKLAGRLKISIVSTAKYVMPYYLSDFIANNEGIEVIVDVTNKSQVIDSLEKNEVDFAMVSILPSNMNVAEVRLIQNELYLVGNPSRKFTEENSGDEIWKDLPLIYREKGSGTRLTMEKYFKEAQIKIDKKMELTSNEAVKQAVIAGLGYSVMPLIGIKNELMNGDLQIIKTKGFPIVTSWHLIWQKNKNHSPVAQAFLNYIRAEKDELLQKKFGWVSQFKF